MLGSQALELGPFNIPVWMIAAAGGYLAALIARRLFFRRHKAVFGLASDFLTSGVLIVLVVWKLTPLVTRFAEIAGSPARILYYPGGTAGLLAGIGLALAFIAWNFRRRSRKGEEAAGDPRKLLLSVAFIAACVVVPVAVVSLIPVAPGGALPAGDVVILDDQGTRSVSLSEISPGAPTVLVFWATWCGPCTAQMPEIQRFHDAYGESVRLLAVNLITTEQSLDTVAEYLADGNHTFPVVLDSRDRLRAQLGVAATPTVVVFSADGNEQARTTGAVTSAWIERRVLPLL